MKRVVVDHFGGPEVLRVVEDEDPRPGPGEVRVRVLAAGVSFTDAQLRAGTYLGGPKPPFTPGYELVGVVEELGPGCSRLREGDRVGALTVWGADAERVCVPEANAVEVPEDLDPAEVVSLVFTVHDRLPAASPHGEGEERGDGARARRGRQGGHRGPRARSAGRASPVRDRFGARPRRGRAARRGGDRLPQRGLPGPGARADRRRRGRRARRARRRAVAALLPRAAARRQACRVSATTPRSRTGARAGEAGSSGTRRPRPSRCGACSRPAGGCSPTGSRSCAIRTHPDWFREDFRALLELLRAARSTRSWPSACRCPTLAARTSCSSSSAATGKLVLVP